MENPVDGARVVVIGGGIAGLATALKLAPMPVTLLVQSPLGTEASTPRAQGGIAAALGADDRPEFHCADTLAAGAGLCDQEVASRVTAEARACIEDLVGWGVLFDCDPAGALALGLEAAHSRRRIVHAGGDSTGYVVIQALMQAARATASIEILEGVRATELVVDGDRVIGVRASRGEVPLYVPSRAVVLATGGVGGLYAHTTNPLGAFGSGLALAARAGAVLRDVEFVQFHPTAIVLGQGASGLACDPLPLASEALRGEGAILVNGRGERFMAEVLGAELAPRDVVARAIWRQIEAGEPVFLDTRGTLGERVATRFPTVTALCREAGLDPAKEPIPVRPAAHYHMGGVAVGPTGRASIAGLWACGEVAATGLHGANRLASNSLLEALAYARWIAQDICASAMRRPVMRPAAVHAAVRSAIDADSVAAIRGLMTDAVGVVRDRAGLASAIERLDRFARVRPQPSLIADFALVGLMIAVAAQDRCESRGAHFRRDHPRPSPALALPSLHTLEQIRARAADMRHERQPVRRGA